jgi:hypothetical protein
LQANQSCKEAGKPKLPRRTGFRAEMRFAATDPDGDWETGAEFVLFPLTPVFPALAEKTGKNTMSNELGTVCVFIGAKLEVTIGPAYTGSSPVQMV